MKSFLALCAIVVALMSSAAFAESFSFSNQGLSFSGVSTSGILAGSTIDGLNVGGVTIPVTGSLLFGTGILTGSLDGGATFSSGNVFLNALGVRIFASNFSGSWSQTSNTLYELVGTFSSTAGGVQGVTTQFFQVQFVNGEASFRDVNGSTTISTVPEPDSLALLGTGLISLAGVARHKLSSAAPLLRFLSRDFAAETCRESGNR